MSKTIKKGYFLTFLSSSFSSSSSFLLFFYQDTAHRLRVSFPLSSHPLPSPSVSDPSSLVLPQSKDLIYSVRKISLLYKIIDRFRTAGTLMRGKKNGDLPCAVLWTLCGFINCDWEWFFVFYAFPNNDNNVFHQNYDFFSQVRKRELTRESDEEASLIQGDTHVFVSTFRWLTHYLCEGPSRVDVW